MREIGLTTKVELLIEIFLVLKLIFRAVGKRREGGFVSLGRSKGKPSCFNDPLLNTHNFLNAVPSTNFLQTFSEILIFFSTQVFFSEFISVEIPNKIWK